MQLLALFLSAAPILALAGHSFEGVSRSRAHAGRHIHPRANSYKLVDNYQGQSFFDGWDFFTEADPTGGQVQFLSRQDATKAGLAYVQQDNTTVVGVDDYTWLAEGQNRKSVRITSKKQYNGGLFMADLWDVPHGCGTWPAWWSTGPNWPEGGEIDIFETTHNNQHNQLSLHTGAGCKMNQTPAPRATTAKADSSKAFTGTLNNVKCETIGGDNTGCGFLDSDTRSAGTTFNTQAGGLYVHLWDSNGIVAWRFDRGAIPQDIVDGNPNPDSWPTPVALWAADNCDMASHFYDHSLIFDITLCGGFGEGTYGQSGCPGTCSQAVQDPNNFKLAKFKIASVKVYQLQ